MTGTATGRFPSEPEMQDLRQHISNPEIVIVGKEIAFAEPLPKGAVIVYGDLETRVLADMAQATGIEQLLDGLFEDRDHGLHVIRHDPLDKIREARMKINADLFEPKRATNIHGYDYQRHNRVRKKR